MLSKVLALVLCSPLSIRASNLAPSVHPGFSAVLRSRSLERFEPQVFQDGQGMPHIADLPSTGLDCVLRVAAQNVGLKEVFAGKCLSPPPGVPVEMTEDEVIRFEDPITGSDVSVWWKPLYSDSNHKEQKGLVIDGIFSRPKKWEKSAKDETSWQGIITETRKFGENAASPFAWWRASFRGASTPHDAESTVLSLIADMEAALKEAVQER